MTGKKNYEVGKCKPPKEHQFKKGQVANPGGKTKEQKRLEMENAKAAMRIRAKLLKATEKKLKGMNADDVVEELVEAAMLKLLKDSEDRGLGAPVQAHTSPDGSMSPQQIIIRAADDSGDN